MRDSTSGGVRLNKYISSSGHCSRREADKLIESNRVKINGKRPELGAQVGPGDVVSVDGREIEGSAENKSDRIYIVYNKPIGITCTTERDVKGNIIDAVDHDQRIFPVGRLDKPSEGIILLTSDGDIVNKILRAENAHSKEYLVTLNKAIASDFASKMSKGLPILGTVTQPCTVTVQGRNVFTIVLTQGLNRQIRRMCEYLGYEVTQLQRVRIMNLSLGRLKSGQWRNVTREEMAQLNKAIEGSRSESSKPGNRKSHYKKALKKSRFHTDSPPQKASAEARRGSASSSRGTASRSTVKSGTKPTAPQRSGKPAAKTGTKTGSKPAGPSANRPRSAPKRRK